MSNNKKSETIICSFLGQGSIYDNDLIYRVSRQLYALVEQHESIEFLFWGYQNFLELCFVSALMVKQHFPDKKITLSLVQSDKKQANYTRFQQQERDVFPYFFADRLLEPQISRSDNCDTNNKRISRWVIQQSTYLICYLYAEMNDPYRSEYQAAKKTGCILLDVTSKETADFLADKACHLPEREKAVLQKRLSGETKKQIREQLSLNNVQTVNKYLSCAFTTLRGSLYHRMRAQRQKDTFVSPVCSIFSMGKATYDSLCLFKQVVSFLVRHCSATKYLVASEYCDSEYMYILKEIAISSEITVMSSAPNWNSPAPSLFPLPFQSIKVLECQGDGQDADPMRLMESMLKQSDFCICNLARNPHAEQIRNYLAKADGAMVLDLGQASSPQRLLTH